MGEKSWMKPSRMDQVSDFEARNLLFFFVITYGWSWLFWLPAVLSPAGYSDPYFFVMFIIGAFGPFVGAFSLTYLNERMGGVNDLWKRFWNLKAEKNWLLASFLLFPALYGVAFMIAVFTEGRIPEFEWVSQPWLLVNFIAISFVGGGFCEEFGWRGYALDRLQVKWNALVSSLILGVVWTFWHLPVWFITGDPHQNDPFFLFLLSITFLSILFTWLYNNTNGNLFVAVVFHTMYNFMSKLNLFSQVILGGIIYVVLFIISVVAVVVIFKPKKLAS